MVLLVCGVACLWCCLFVVLLVCGVACLWCLFVCGDCFFVVAVFFVCGVCLFVCL